MTKTAGMDADSPVFGDAACRPFFHSQVTNLQVLASIRSPRNGSGCRSKSRFLLPFCATSLWGDRSGPAGGANSWGHVRLSLSEFEPSRRQHHDHEPTPRALGAPARGREIGEGSATNGVGKAQTQVAGRRISRPRVATRVPGCSLQTHNAPRVGLEPTTNRLTAGCSTIELSGNPTSRHAGSATGSARDR